MKCDSNMFGCVILFVCAKISISNDQTKQRENKDNSNTTPPPPTITTATNNKYNPNHPNKK
eukprot:m.21365 g.21365  ORF g.21365 m.21365 type:complete len:61 (+) comp13358_c0_seq1:98-280(+)